VGSPIRQAIEHNLLRSDELTTKLVQHLKLVGISIAITVVIGLPLAVALFKSGRVTRVLTLALASLGQAVPSIALLTLVSTYIGLGVGPAVIALVAYALLPVLRNTLVGLEGVDPAALEAARGMGMTPLQMLLRVELPLASPVIMAGLRTSLVLIVGTATLGNFIGAGGLGDIIGEGITAAVIGPRVVLAGAAAAAGLALLADWAMSLAAYIVVPRT
jgi:osmoprotectant transport system permease protein